MDVIQRLQQRLGYSFRDQSILVQALTHTSYGYEYLQDQELAARDNERMEFLGDAILDLIVSDLLLAKFKSANEGLLSRMRAAIVNEKALAEVAKILGLNECVRLGKGEEQTGGRDKASILSSTLEAVIAALYQDAGFALTSELVRKLMIPHVLDEKDLVAFHDYKTQLQEAVQARFRMTPSYHLVRAQGPDHAKIFEVEVRMGSKPMAVASGPSKKEAEQNAARSAIQEVATASVDRN